LKEAVLGIIILVIFRNGYVHFFYQCENLNDGICQTGIKEKSKQE